MLFFESAKIQFEQYYTLYFTKIFLTINNYLLKGNEYYA